MKKCTVGILYGGRSVEHEISILSATNIAENIDLERYNIRLIGIDKMGRWHLCNSISQPINDGQLLDLALNSEVPTFKFKNESFTVDVVFPVLHGTDGEDGSIQGLLQSLNIPFVGSGVMGSAVSMDKLTAKVILQQDGIPVADFLAYSRFEQEQISFDNIKNSLGLPFMLKPANLGSSVGVAKISSEDNFEQLVKDTFQYDNILLFEEYINGKEMECAVFGNDNPVASVPGEINLSSDYEFYSFDAKYVDKDAASLVIPAKVSEEVSDLIRVNSLRSYELLHCADLARVDLFVNDNGSVFVNEVNTMPGFTNISMYPRLMAFEGIGYKDLMTQLIEMALKRHQLKNELSTNYESNL